MGCASSGPLVEKGKMLADAAKDSVKDVAAKGEKAIHDVGDTAKEGISTEMGKVKGAVESAMTSAENSVSSVMGKFGNTFTSTTENAGHAINGLETSAEEALNTASDNINEASSEAETVIMSEADHFKEDVDGKVSAAFDKIDSKKDDLDSLMEKGKDALHIEDMEQDFHMLGDSVQKVENRTEEIIANNSTKSTPAKESKKEESPPTLWEAAADAIVLQKITKTMVPLQIPTAPKDSEKEVDIASVTELLAEFNKENHVIIDKNTHRQLELKIDSS